MKEKRFERPWRLMPLAEFHFNSLGCEKYGV